MTTRNQAALVDTIHDRVVRARPSKSVIAITVAELVELVAWSHPSENPLLLGKKELAGARVLGHECIIVDLPPGRWWLQNGELTPVVPSAVAAQPNRVDTNGYEQRGP